MTKRSRKARHGGTPRDVRIKNASHRKELTEFLRDRDNALLALDLKTFLAFVLKWQGWTGVNPAMLDSEALTWVVIHRMRTAVKSLPLKERRVSKAWLAERQLKSSDEGEL